METVDDQVLRAWPRQHAPAVRRTGRHEGPYLQRHAGIIRRTLWGTMSEVENLLRDEVEHAENHQDAPAGPQTTISRPGHARSTVYSVRLNPDEVAALQVYAEDAGLPASTLVRSWIIERLRENDAAPDLRKIIHDEVQAAVRDALQQAT